MLENMYLLLGAADSAGSGESTGGFGGITGLLPFVLIFLVMYLIIIRPQSKKQKAHRNMMANLGKGEKVVTIGGIHGKIDSVAEKTVIIQVDGNTKMEFNKESIANIVSSSPNNAPQAAKPKKDKAEKTEEIQNSTPEQTEEKETTQN